MSVETRLESRIVTWVRGQGGLALKGGVAHDTGFPDRIVFLVGTAAYVEVKGDKGYRLTEKQKVWAGRIIAARQPYYVVDSYETFEAWKEKVYYDVPRLMENMYCLNGFQLWLRVNDVEGTYDVLSMRGDVTNKLIAGKRSAPLADTVYYVLKMLEEMYPGKLYSEI